MSSNSNLLHIRKVIQVMIHIYAYIEDVTISMRICLSSWQLVTQYVKLCNYHNLSRTKNVSIFPCYVIL